MRIVVTGGSGKLGRAVVATLLKRGHRVIIADLNRPPLGEHREFFVRADLRELAQAVEVLTHVDEQHGTLPVGSGSGIDALVHLAAIPAPGLLTDSATFGHNTSITYNLFTAARLAGVSKVVYASSETLLGVPFEASPPARFPIDEEQPIHPQSAYSLGKAVDEELARHFARWMTGSTFIGLRFSNVMDADDYAAFPTFAHTPKERAWNAWAYVDARDAAFACARAVERSLTGAHEFIIAAADTVMSSPSLDLAREFFPTVPIAEDIAGHTSLLSSDKARQLLGYIPEHSWRTSRDGSS